jgi:uncharacterized protein YhaN
MYLERIHIDGYGIFSGYDLPGDPDGDGFSKKLTVVIGPNESGKTTLLSFVRAILFGFPDGRRSKNPYLPLAGGKYGGLITLVDGDGERHTVERSAGTRGGAVRVMMPGGSVGGTSDLDALLGYASGELFRNVFAFGLDELQAFETLASDEVSARIYSAGLGAGRLSIGEIEARIEKMRGELFTTDRAASRQITGLLNECAQIRRQLQDIEGQASRYSDLGNELRALNDRLGELRKARGEKRIALDHCDNLLRAWESWTEMQAAKDKLSKLPAIQRFPTDGLSRLEVVLERIRAEKENLKRTQSDLDSQQKELDSISLNRALIERGPEMVSLERGLAKYVSAREDLPKREAELKGQIEELNHSLSDLGPEWDEDHVLAFDTSIPARDTVREHGSRLADRQQKLHDAKLAASQASETLEETRRELRREEDNLGKIPEPRDRDKAAVEIRLRFARSLLAGLSDYRTRLQEKDDLVERGSDKKTYATRMERQLSQSTETMRLPLAITVLLVLVPVFGWLALFYLRRASARLQQQRRNLESDLTETETELKSVLEKVSFIENEIKKEQERLSSIAQNAGLGRIPSASEAGELVNRLDDDLQKLGVWLAASEKVADVRERFREADQTFERARTSRSQAEEDLARAEKEWAEWLKGHGIKAECLPATALELLSKVESARERAMNVARTRERAAAIEDSMKKYEDATNAILVACGETARLRMEFPGVVDRLIERFKTAQKNNERTEQLQRVIRQRVAQRDAFQDALGSAEKDLHQLLSEGGADSEEAFREREKNYREIGQLNTVVQNCTRALEKIAGRKEALAAFMSELETATPEKLQERKRVAGEELRTIDAEVEGSQKEWGMLKRQVDELERTEEASSLRLNLSVLQEKLQVKARRWVALTIAQTLLREARAKYERERKPAVVQQGQHFFSMITSDRYPRLISPPGETQIQLEDRSGHRKPLTVLSRGTAEQLYLALRFGLVKEFSRRSESLPVVMDDILVNFDPERAEEAARAIAELADENQVIVFTCHPRTADLLKARAPESLLVKLDDHQG